VGEGDAREAGFELTDVVRLDYCTTGANRFFEAHETSSVIWRTRIVGRLTEQPWRCSYFGPSAPFRGGV
jgi:hypothetical protein